MKKLESRPFTGFADGHEWDRQERGMLAARGGDSETIDPLVDTYRQVAAALITAPSSEPPADFAEGVVRRIAQRRVGIERALFRGLAIALAGALLIFFARYFEQWWLAMQYGLTSGALRWVAAGIGCIVVSWLIGQFQQLVEIRGSESWL